MYKDLKRTCTAIVLLIKSFGDVLVAVVVVVCLKCYYDLKNMSSVVRNRLKFGKISWTHLLCTKM